MLPLPSPSPSLSRASSAPSLGGSVKELGGKGGEEAPKVPEMGTSGSPATPKFSCNSPVVYDNPPRPPKTPASGHRAATMGSSAATGLAKGVGAHQGKPGARGPAEQEEKEEEGPPVPRAIDGRRSTEGDRNPTDEAELQGVKPQPWAGTGAYWSDSSDEEEGKPRVASSKVSQLFVRTPRAEQQQQQQQRPESPAPGEQQQQEPPSPVGLGLVTPSSPAHDTHTNRPRNVSHATTNTNANMSTLSLNEKAESFPSGPASPSDVFTGPPELKKELPKKKSFASIRSLARKHSSGDLGKNALRGISNMFSIPPLPQDAAQKIEQASKTPVTPGEEAKFQRAHQKEGTPTPAVNNKEQDFYTIPAQATDENPETPRATAKKANKLRAGRDFIIRNTRKGLVPTKQIDDFTEGEIEALGNLVPSEAPSRQSPFRGLFIKMRGSSAEKKKQAQVVEEKLSRHQSLNLLGPSRFGQDFRVAQDASIPELAREDENDDAINDMIAMYDTTPTLTDDDGTQTDMGALLDRRIDSSQRGYSNAAGSSKTTPSQPYQSSMGPSMDQAFGYNTQGRSGQGFGNSNQSLPDQDFGHSHHESSSQNQCHGYSSNQSRSGQGFGYEDQSYSGQAFGYNNQHDYRYHAYTGQGAYPSHPAAPQHRDYHNHYARAYRQADPALTEGQRTRSNTTPSSLERAVEDTTTQHDLPLGATFRDVRIAKRIDADQAALASGVNYMRQKSEPSPPIPVAQFVPEGQSPSLRQTSAPQPRRGHKRTSMPQGPRAEQDRNSSLYSTDIHVESVVAPLNIHRTRK